MMRVLILAVLLMVVVTSSALAEPQMTARRLSDAEVQQLFPAVRQDCQVGNLNLPSWGLSGLLGQQGFKYLYSRPDDCACPFGYAVTQINTLLSVGADDVPVDITVSADLEEAVWDVDLQCYVPGDEICVATPVTYQIDVEGLYIIPVPIDCACVFKGYNYFLSFHYENLLAPSTPLLVTDEFPSACTSYFNGGSGWQDLYDLGWDQFGNIIIYADVECCELPVGNQEDTWGGVKSLYH